MRKRQLYDDNEDRFKQNPQRAAIWGAPQFENRDARGSLAQSWQSRRISNALRLARARERRKTFFYLE
jgi:DNA-directed RNA polymerase